MLKIKDLLQKQYDLFKEEYQKICNELPTKKEEEKEEKNRLRENGYDDIDIYYNKNWCASRLNMIIEEKDAIIHQQPILLEKMSKINEILNNDEHIISLKRTQLEKFSKGKIILEVGTSAIGNSNANINGKLSGGLSGSSFLGFGNIDGSVDGYIKGNSNSHYEEYILVKYKYNLDYELEEFLFNIDDYLVEKVGDE